YRSLLDPTANIIGSGGFGLSLRWEYARLFVGLPAILHIMRLDSFDKSLGREIAPGDPALPPGPGGGEPIAGARVADLLKPVGTQRSGPSDLRRRTAQRRPAGLFVRWRSGDNRWALARRFRGMALLRQVELAAILVLPFVAVFVGHKSVSVPKG